ncbi:MAG: GldG family protein [Epulopiscium sp.]|nr:GldG family protein [Candidatus Epulonipiscium sp.]
MNKKKFQKHLKYGTNSVIFTIAVVGVIILLNLMLSSNPLKWDLTRDKIYSLSETGKKALKDVNEEVKILFFADPSDSIAMDVKQLYENMHSINDKISMEIIDPMKNPSLVNEYQITSMYTSVVSSSKRTKQVPSYDLIRTNYETGEQYFDGEGTLIQAILDVTAEKQTKVYILEGHGEFQKDQDLVVLSSLLEQKGVLVESYSLTGKTSLPEDADIIYIIGPQFDYTSEEVNALKDYLDKGGKMVLAFNHYTEGENFNNLKELSASYGIHVEDSILTDPTRNYSGDEETLIPEYVYHEIIEKLDEDRIATIIPKARGLSVNEKEDITTSVILQTSEERPIAIASEKELNDNKKTQLLVIGNAFFAHDQVIGLAGNTEIFFGALKWFSTDSAIVDIPLKTYTSEPLVLVGSQAFLIFSISVLLIPLFVFVFGGMIYFRRRSL